MEDGPPFSATDVLSVTVTVAGIAIALAAIRPGSPAVPFFLTAGLFATGGSLYALATLWTEAGLRFRHSLGLNRPERLGSRYEALLCTILGLLLLTGAYVALLFSTFL